jgi:hypothetical protein
MMPKRSSKKKPGPEPDHLNIELAPEEALRRLLTAPPEKKHRAAQKKRRKPS